MLQINTDPVGKGKERACFVHPDDPQKAIKISIGDSSEQSRREIKFYQKRQKSGSDSDQHTPRFYGLCETSLGQGIVVDMIRDQVIFQHASNRIAIQLPVRLRAGCPDGRAFACIQCPELDARPVDRLRHGAPQRVYFPRQVALANAADGGITTHLPQRRDVLR